MNSSQLPRSTGKAGKARDVEMIISALRFANGLDDQNLVAHSVLRMQAGELAGHYAELQAARSPGVIIQVGPKVAAFYLRDLVSLFSLDEGLSDSDAALLQPVDVWVRRLVAPSGAGARGCAR